MTNNLGQWWSSACIINLLIGTNFYCCLMHLVLFLLKNLILSLVIEIDGAGHLDEKQMIRDKYRNDYLRGKELEVFRIPNMEIFSNIDGVVDEIYNRVSQKVLKRGTTIGFFRYLL